MANEPMRSFENYCRERKWMLDKSRGRKSVVELVDSGDQILEIVCSDDDLHFDGKALVQNKTVETASISLQPSNSWSVSSNSIIPAPCASKCGERAGCSKSSVRKSIQSYTGQLFSPVYEVSPEQQNVFQENRRPIPTPGHTPKYGSLSYKYNDSICETYNLVDSSAPNFTQQNPAHVLREENASSVRQLPDGQLKETSALFCSSLASESEDIFPELSPEGERKEMKALFCASSSPASNTDYGVKCAIASELSPAPSSPSKRGKTSSPEMKANKCARIHWRQRSTPNEQNRTLRDGWSFESFDSSRTGELSLSPILGVASDDDSEEDILACFELEHNLENSRLLSPISECDTESGISIEQDPLFFERPISKDDDAAGSTFITPVESETELVTTSSFKTRVTVEHQPPNVEDSVLTTLNAPPFVSETRLVTTADLKARITVVTGLESMAPRLKTPIPIPTSFLMDLLQTSFMSLCCVTLESSFAPVVSSRLIDAANLRPSPAASSQKSSIVYHLDRVDSKDSAKKRAATPQQQCCSLTSGIYSFGEQENCVKQGRKSLIPTASSQVRTGDGSPSRALEKDAFRLRLSSWRQKQKDAEDDAPMCFSKMCPEEEIVFSVASPSHTVASSDTSSFGNLLLDEELDDILNRLKSPKVLAELFAKSPRRFPKNPLEFQPSKQVGRNLRVDDEKRLLVSPQLLSILSTDTSAGEGEQEENLLKDAELRAVMKITDDGNDTTSLFPSFSDDSDSCLKMSESDDGLGDELSALMNFEDDLRQEMEIAKTISDSSQSLALSKMFPLTSPLFTTPATKVAAHTDELPALTSPLHPRVEALSPLYSANPVKQASSFHSGGTTAFHSELEQDVVSDAAQATPSTCRFLKELDETNSTDSSMVNLHDVNATTSSSTLSFRRPTPRSNKIARRVRFNDEIQEFLFVSEIAQQEHYPPPPANDTEETFIDEVLGVFDDLIEELTFACTSVAAAIDHSRLPRHRKSSKIRRSSVT